MKKIKKCLWITIIYVMAVALTLSLTRRIEKLESIEDEELRHTKISLVHSN